MLRKEASVFLVVGCLAVAIDFAAYQLLVMETTVNRDAAKGISFLVGTVFAYVANRFWTFGHHTPAAGSTWKFGMLYSTTLIANVGINAMVLALLRFTMPSWGFAVTFAFLAATGVSAVLNFLGMKFLVFKPATVQAV